MRRMKVTYQTNDNYDGQDRRVPRLFASIDLSKYGIEESIKELPIYFRNLDKPIGPIMQTYSAWVAGLFLEKGNLGSLEESIDLYLGALIHFGRLPAYLFRLGNNAWPIYHLPDQLVTRYPGNPVMGASTVGELRVALSEYFKRAGLIANRKELDILYLSRHDLQLYPPVCSFRAEGLADIPVFPIQYGRELALTAPVNTMPITVSCRDGNGILALHEAVSNYLMEREMLGNSSALTIRKLSNQAWKSVQIALNPLDRRLTYYDEEEGRLVMNEIPVYANGKYLVGARTNHLERTSLYIAADIQGLQGQLGHELHIKGRLPSPDYVTVSRAQV